MTAGKAHGADRQYQIECRDVLTFRNPELAPWADEVLTYRSNFLIPAGQSTLRYATAPAHLLLLNADERLVPSDKKT